MVPKKSIFGASGHFFWTPSYLSASIHYPPRREHAQRPSKSDEEASIVAVLAQAGEFLNAEPRSAGSLCRSRGCEPPSVSYSPKSHTVQDYREQLVGKSLRIERL